MSSESSFWSGSSKNMFFTGLILGVAVSAIIALVVLLSMVLSGKTMAANNGGAGAQVVQQYPTGDTQQPMPSYKPVKEVDEKVDHILGNKNAKVTMIEYSDFECPFCQRHLPAVKQALADFPNDVRLVYRHYPLSFHPAAQPAAEASECAAKLGGNDAFWNMHDKLFENQASLNRDTYVRLAKELKLNESNFVKCIDSKETAGRVNADAASGNDSGVEGTPATFVNGQLISGAVPYEQLKAALQAAGAQK